MLPAPISSHLVSYLVQSGEYTGIVYLGWYSPSIWQRFSFQVRCLFYPLELNSTDRAGQRMPGALAR